MGSFCSTSIVSSSPSASPPHKHHDAHVFPSLPESHGPICAIEPHERPAWRALQPLLRACLSTGSIHDIPSLIRSRLTPSRALALPHGMRWMLYQHLSGGADLACAYPRLYKSLLSLGPAPDAYDVVIRRDVHRTLPSIPFFGPRTSPGPGQSQVYRMCTAYSWLDGSVGYTQGMSFLAALILLSGASEQAAFFTFAAVMIRLGLRLFYLPSLPAATLCHDLIADALRARAPRLAKKLEEASVLPALYATPWLLSFFVSSPLPLSTVLVLLDRLLLEGHVAPIPPMVAEAQAMADAAAAAAAVAEGDMGGNGSPVGGVPAAVPSYQLQHDTQPRKVGAARRASSLLRMAASALGGVRRGDAVPVASVPLASMIPPVMVRACVHMVLVHSRALLQGRGTDELFLTIKDEYDETALVAAASLPPARAAARAMPMNWMYTPLRASVDRTQMHRMPSAPAIVARVGENYDATPRFELAPEHTFAEYGAAVSLRTMDTEYDRYVASLAAAAHDAGVAVGSSATSNVPAHHVRNVTAEQLLPGAGAAAAPMAGTTAVHGVRAPRRRGLFFASTGVTARPASRSAAGSDASHTRPASFGAAADGGDDAATGDATVPFPPALARVPSSPQAPDAYGASNSPDRGAPARGSDVLRQMSSVRAGRRASVTCDGKPVSRWTLPPAFVKGISQRSVWVTVQELVAWEAARK